MKLTKETVVKIINTFQLAMCNAGEDEIGEEGYLLLAQHTKYYRDSVVLDWMGLLEYSDKTDKERKAMRLKYWDFSISSLKKSMPKYSAKLDNLKGTSLEKEFVEQFDEFTKEAKEIVQTLKDPKEAVVAVYEKLGLTVHIEVVKRYVEKPAETTEKPVAAKTQRVQGAEQAPTRKKSKAAKSGTGFSLENATIEDLDLIERAIEATEAELARLVEVREHLNKQLAFYALPPIYELPTEGNHLVRLELSGYKLVHQSLTECVMQKGDDSIILKVDAWVEARNSYATATNRIGEDKLLEVVTTVQPFYIDPVKDEWNYTNIAIHLYNQLNVLVSPQILPHLDFFRNNSAKQWLF
ncbi:hypothetical protein AVV29_gp013 [Vibrio phage phi 3]|uniref:Uncharacterized protein n=1 Tax=Vibrio phage phi 3 TaxID=1589298 RepID=A0A0B5GYK8_9CAUD|nr:hypothetical protein AVV29_gp013 [Vibrio phage phi 3]AJF40781.1 hypothetical protein SBVP3_0013 [Vibrio phage phi 3]